MTSEIRPIKRLLIANRWRVCRKTAPKLDKQFLSSPKKAASLIYKNASVSHESLYYFLRDAVNFTTEISSMTLHFKFYQANIHKAYPQVSSSPALLIRECEIATRILTTTLSLNIETYTLYTARDTTHTHSSTHSILLPSPSAYLDISLLISIVKSHNIDTVHPGYGLLSESPEFSRRMRDEANCHVIGPGPEILEKTGDKLKARELAQECSGPVLPALQTPTSSTSSLAAFGDKVGYPLIIKAVDGGGGRGIRIVHEASEAETLARLALKESPSGKAFAEKAAINGYRHIEVQVIGDGKGNIRHLWERECSIQRRFQKVVEFTPSSIPNRELIAQVINSAIRIAKAVNYASLGTFEFLVHSQNSEFYFLEINPRIQVEHTITEQLSLRLDLIKLQLLLSQNHSLESVFPGFLGQDPKVPPPIYSIQLRLTAEDASNSFSLSVGKIRSFRFPNGHGVRVDTHLVAGQETVVGTDFDSLLAKIIITASTWEECVAKARRALQDTWVEGVKTNVDVLRGVVGSEEFANGRCDTLWLERNLPDVLKGGKALELKKIPTSQTSITGAVGASSNVLFRKGDAWSISLTPETKEAEEQTLISHLQLSKVNHNEFPTSLTASILYTTPSHPSPKPYALTLASTTASFASLSNASTHRRGDANNPNHVTFPFPGKLMEILIDVGDEVKEGDTVAVVRQMKMELEIRASRGGVVKWIYEGDEGDDIGEGVLVVELEDKGSSKL